LFVLLLAWMLYVSSVKSSSTSWIGHFQFEVTIPFVCQRPQVTFAAGGGRDGKVVFMLLWSVQVPG
jgi:hypothetical protein